MQECSQARGLTAALQFGIILLTFILGGEMAAGKRDDPKVRALREARSLNPRPEAVSDPAFVASEFLDARDLVQVKYEMVRRVRVEGEQVARAADAFGFSRQSFYATQAALDQGGLEALVPQRPGPRRAHKLSEEVLAFCREQLGADPELKPRDLVALIAERFGVQVHPRSIERALARQEAGARSPKSG
jgi:transposase